MPEKKAKNIEKEYTRLISAYNLPEFKELERAFDIEETESKRVLAEIRKQIEEKITTIRSVIEDILYPEASIAALHENSAFTENEKERVVRAYKRSMYWYRRSFANSLENQQEKDALFIKEIIKEWPTLKKDFVWIAKKIEQIWEKSDENKEFAQYFG